MREHNGWVLPTADKYFIKFMTGKTGYKKNEFQREHLEKAFEYVTDWSLAIDVGAHVGFWAHDMAKRFEQVHCFEGAPDTFKCLTVNMREHSNVFVHETVLGDKAGHAVVAHDEKREREGNTGSRYFVSAKKGTTVTTLDSYNFASCGLLKVDVEGAEYMVLRGAKRLLTHRPVVIMETDKPFSQRRYGIDLGAAQRLLESYGYEQVEHMKPDRIFVHRG